MRKSIIAALLCMSTLCQAQTVEETFPQTLFCPNDTVLLKYKDFPKYFPYRVSRTDKVSPGTDASPDLYIRLYYGKDSVQINYHNHLPYAHIIYVNLESPKGKTVLRLHFNDLASYFPQAYMKSNLGNVQFDIPEPYELANIIWTLSPSGRRATDLYTKGPYYERVMAHFKPFMNHPLFQRLDFPDSLYADNYYVFRENSFAFNFKDNKPGSKDATLLFNGPYYYVFGDELADSSLFGKLKPLVEDFARKSGFRKFYQENKPFYAKQLARQRELLPVRKMWDWLETQFVKPTYQSYRVVSSPLIGGSHSTQRYSTFTNDKLFSENVMFICGTDRYDEDKDLSEKRKEGMMSGIVFTEIDHNYVNPTSNKYRSRIDSIFSNRATWAKTGNSSDFYGEPISVFNEYMTHALFCVYILDNYEAEDADYVIGKRESLMVDRRNFIHFKEFNQELLRLHREQPAVKMADLYPAILDWCERQ